MNQRLGKKNLLCTPRSLTEAQPPRCCEGSIVFFCCLRVPKAFKQK